MTRFSETDKWRDPWFRGLKPPQKLLFLFIVDNCNNAGFWEEDVSYACYCTGMDEEQYKASIKGLVRGLVGASGWYWVRTFLKHQRNADLNPENRAHSQIIRLIAEQTERFKAVPEFKAFLAPYKGLLSPSGICKGKGTGKEEGTGETKKARATQEEVAEFFTSEGLPESDGVWFFEKCQGNGWTNGGKPIKDWRATVRSWRAGGYIPSLKQSQANGRTHEPVKKLKSSFDVYK